MAANMYIRFEGPAITGASTAAGHAGEIEMLSWSHGFVQPTSPAPVQATHQNFSFTKYLDSASNELMKYFWSGQQFQKANVSLYRGDGDGALYLTIAMEHVIILNVSVSGGPGGVPVENISLDYGLLQYNYIDQK
jgi:type VI secretion system secreted protein Hcp